MSEVVEDGRRVAGASPRFAIIGAGMAGILSGIKLKEAGFDFVIYEKAEQLGGTWRENTYPGIACDVPSHLYSYSFAPNTEWSHLFSPGAEIQNYFENVARESGVDRSIRFGKEIAGCRFDEGRWRIETTDGDVDHADFVIAATGVLHHPNIPKIDGVEDFAGETIHTARWSEEMDLKGKRVGIVGTGSSAVQMVGAVVDEVESLHLFQRTAQWVMPQTNPEYTEEEKADFRANPELVNDLRAQISRSFADNFANAVVDPGSEALKLMQQYCVDHLEQTVLDPELRERLRPDYRAGCKRLVISGNFYPAIQRPNATLVSERIERVEAQGVRTVTGDLHEFDVLVLATGFRVDRFMRPMDIVGRGGVALDDLWEKRPSAYLSISVPGFPNLFMLNGPNGPVGNFSLIEVAEIQFRYIMQLVEEVTSGRCREVSASLEATKNFDRERSEAAMKTIWATGCRSWYLDDRGIPAVWPWTFDRFREDLATPDLTHYEIR